MEFSCAGSSCAYTQYGAYHGYFLNGSTPVIYGNEPYAAAGYCQAGSSPNGDAAGDAAASNGAKANEFWPISYTVSNYFGTSFELQQEYDNHTASCVQVGP
ncbi:MAG: hypothetical protein ACR2JB_01660 [Bryobacteraceae bacterium]